MYWSDYCHDATYAPKYRQKAAEFLKQAVGLLSKNDKRYNFFLGEYYIYVERNDKKALSHYFRVLKEVPVNSRYYAMAAFAIANNYSANHQSEKYEEYIVQACISDLKNCTRENLALQDFAMYIYTRKTTRTFLEPNATSTLPWMTQRRTTTDCASSKSRKSCLSLSRTIERS